MLLIVHLVPDSLFQGFSFRFSGRSSYRSFSGSQRSSVRSRSRRSRDDPWVDVASTSAATSGSSSASAASSSAASASSAAATSGGSRASKRHHRSSASSSATSTHTAASVMGGSVSSKAVVQLDEARQGFRIKDLESAHLVSTPLLQMIIFSYHEILVCL